MNNFDSHTNDYLMTVNGLSVGLNMPQALQSQTVNGLETAHSLPPYHRRRAFLVDEYPACPEGWMRSSGRIKSFFVPIIEGAGLWLDLNACSNHANHVAAVISIQGINAVTGLPCKDPQLEQYKDQCPKHKETFGPDRLCKKCGFKWPKQNYLCTTGTPYGGFWLDGFRAEDGSVRQYLFTASETRGVAAGIIGKDRVFALGVSFFKSKEPKPAPSPIFARKLSFSDINDGYGSKGLDFMLHDAETIAHAAATIHYCADTSTRGITSKSTVEQYDKILKSSKHEAHATLGVMHRSNATVKLSQNLEIAAGARIDQSVYDDPNDLEFWQQEPDGIIVINYCLESEAEAIIEAGKVDLSGHKDGFMANLPVGNPCEAKVLP
jgi:hypothetical protein